MPPRKIKVVDVLNEACDDNVLPEAIEDIDPSDKQTPGVQEQTPQQPSPQGLGHEEQVEQVEQVAQPVSNIKTVELVECPDCKKKMTKKTLKHSHAKNCTAKVPSVEEAKEEEFYKSSLATEEEEEEEEEVKPCAKQQVPTPPVLKRTVSVARPKQPPPVKKTVNKVKQPQPACKDQPQQPTPTSIYGRENRNERAKQKTEKMCNLFVDAF